MRILIAFIYKRATTTFEGAVLRAKDLLKLSAKAKVQPHKPASAPSNPELSIKTMRKISLILGGAASGKSHYAESLAETYAKKLYIATARAADEEMQTRIEAHRQRRGSAWQTVEAPMDLSQALGAIEAETRDPGTVILIDCLTLWLTNLMLAERDLQTATDDLVHALKAAEADIIMVSNEVGHGIVPENTLARRFRDEQGRLNQTLASIATNVIFVTAGLPLILKDNQPLEEDPTKS